MKRSAVYVVGSANIDIVVPVGRLPLKGETIAGGAATLVPGGKGANQACASARLGAPTAFVGQLGSDPFAWMLRESLETAGVALTLCGQVPGPTGSAWIAVYPDGGNSIVISAGANAALTPDVAVSRLSALGAADIVLLQWETSLATFAAVAEYARERRAVVILDPAPVQRVDSALLRLVNILTPNQVEAGALLGETAATTPEQARRHCAALVDLGIDAVVLKAGELGCFSSEGSEPFQVAGHKVTAVDTTAAGDVFNGALAARLSAGDAFLDAVKYANAAAAVSVTRAGAQTSIPLDAEVRAMLAVASAAQTV